MLGVDPSAGKAKWGVALAAPDTRGWRLRLASQEPPRRAIRLVERLAGQACLCAIDSPLTPQPPRGLKPCERAALRLGARLLPGSPQMRMLTATSMPVAALCMEAGAAPLEVHPSTTALKLGLPKPRDYGANRHVAEAVLAAATGALYAEGRAILVKARRCCIALPIREGEAARLAASLLAGIPSPSPL